MKRYVNFYTKTLGVNDLLPFNVYIQRKEGQILWRGKSTQVRSEDINRLLESGVKYVMLEIEEDDQQYADYLESKTETIIKDDTIPIEYKVQVIRDISYRILGDLFETPEDPKVAKRLEKIASSVVHLIMEKTESLGKLIERTKEFSYTVHSARTSYYTVALAIKLRKFTRDELVQIGLAALLHDVGKMRVREEIREKIGPYSQGEWGEMKKHPSYSLAIINKVNIRKFESPFLMAIEGHHELGDMTGYPHHLALFNTPIAVQILVVTHTFDSYTTNRIHRKGQSAIDALRYMVEQREKYPVDIVRSFIFVLKNIPKY